MRYEKVQAASEESFSPDEVFLKNKLEAAYTRMQSVQTALNEAEADLKEMKGALAQLESAEENTEAREIVRQIDLQVEILRSAFIAAAKIHHGIRALQDPSGEGEKFKPTLH